ncbi:MAG: glycoside hydrolase family 97 protein [Bacteroidales bacterium]|nr:glycoside hydrolase family 97 protein [Bacteroidales bacterium]
MTLKTLCTAFILSASASALAAAADGSYQVVSPDGSLRTSVVVGDGISYTVQKGETEIIAPSSISMTFDAGIVFGQNDKVRKVLRRSIDETIPTDVYKNAEVRDNYNEMELVFKEFSLIFRAYDEGVAYRFRSQLKTGGKVLSERAEFAFSKDWEAYIPYVAQHTQTLESQYFNSFENTYTVQPLSSWDKKRLAFLPLAVSADNGLKVLVTEADLLSYPGMYLYNADGSTTLEGRYAPYPKDVEQGGHNMLQGIVKTREDYIATAEAGASFPWRVIMVVENDVDLAVNNLVWKLATPASPDEDYSWVRPGKVAWDWWNDWNIYGVDFRAGINNDTYKYYIDFAAAHGIGYVILDEGWAVNLKADLMQVIPEIDLPMLTQYASERGVGLILWAGYKAFDRDMENVCRHYSEMGIKGFKVDFMDRDDQQMVDFYVRSAKMGAKYHMMMDFHGAYKPTGLNRTYPNVINFEGVHGLEQMKWSKDADQVTYDVTVPYIRMAAGPMDYTQGAMRNSIKSNYRPVNSEPMSQGTRCHQLAEYVIFDSPLNMLCDSPSNYMAEPECTKYISECPVVWDETIGINGEMGKYISMARRSGNVWYAGSLNGWDSRDLTLDLGFLGEGRWTMEIFRDGPNADRAARDFRHEVVSVPADRKVTVHLAPGGGWTARITRN